MPFIMLNINTGDDPVFDKENCTCNGIPLYGKVRVVESVWADFDVEVTESVWSDLKVKKVTSFPNKCGEWQFVDGFPDFTIRYVKSNPDFTIKFVDTWPGVN
ncbi:MAG: hypothetical protein PHU62_10070 [Bacteroidales bacterium]|nr:hypothetical protein [Bacteroidales bacterium]MDD2205659.1 hypothetical protein [Bacteroidales bacterium]MDD3153043.1 hypothetical protein [Bacteroidales bacterium]MDD4634895.1 hypothetical protein [Bacteroidales bacterium]